MLKMSKACTPGYARMLSFFTTRPKFKTMPIPLWVVGMVGNSSDMGWAIDNAAYIDPDSFAKFREKTVLSVLKCLYWTTMSVGDPKSTNPLAQEAAREIRDVTTGKGAEAVLVKWGRYHFAGSLWSDVIESPIWGSPQQYIAYVINNQKRGTTRSHRRAIPRVKESQLYFPYNSSLSVVENFARLCLGDDPYPVLVEMISATKLHEKRGIQISKLEEGGSKKYMATINVTDPKRIFQLAHLMNADHVDVLDIAGVNESISSVESAGCDGETELDANQLATLHDLSVRASTSELQMPECLTLVEAGRSQKSVPEESRDESRDDDEVEDDEPITRAPTRYACPTPRGRRADRVTALDGDDEES